jgi:hypothetical protein
MKPQLVRVFYTRHPNTLFDDLCVDLVQWCKEQVENYAVLFGKQVFSPDADPKMIAECNDITRVQNKKVSSGCYPFTRLIATDAIQVAAGKWTRLLLLT